MGEAIDETVFGEGNCVQDFGGLTRLLCGSFPLWEVK